MFDSVVMLCPSCEAYLSLQSKAGECALKEYPIHNVPVEIAVSIEGDTVVCPTCNTKFRIYRQVAVDFVPMQLVAVP